MSYVNYWNIVKMGMRLVLLLTMIVVFSSCMHESVTPTVSTAPVERTNLDIKVSFNGYLSFPASKQEVFLVNGIVSDVLVNEGDYVEKDQVLAKLSISDTAELSAQVDSQIVMLDAATQQLDPVIKNSIADKLEDAKEDYRSIFIKWLGLALTEEYLELPPEDIFKNLGVDDPKSLISDSIRIKNDDPNTAWDESAIAFWYIIYPGSVEWDCESTSQGNDTLCIKDELDSAWKNIKNRQNEYSQQELRISSLIKDLEKAEDNLADVQLVASTAGTVTDVNMSIGDQSIPESSQSGSSTDSSKYITIENLNDIQLVGSVTEFEVGIIKEGLPVTITVNSFPNTPLEGKLKKVGEGRGLEFQVNVDIDSIKGLDLVEGMNASAVITPINYENVLTIPVSAIQGTIDNPYVTVRESMNNVETPVKVGDSNGISVIILEGLEENQMVVVPESTDNTDNEQQFGGPGPGNRRR